MVISKHFWVLYTAVNIRDVEVLRLRGTRRPASGPQLLIIRAILVLVGSFR